MQENKVHKIFTTRPEIYDEEKKITKTHDSLVQRSALARASLHPLMDLNVYKLIKEYHPFQNNEVNSNIKFFLEKKLPMKALKWAMKTGLNHTVTNIINNSEYKPLLDWNILAGYCIKYGYPHIYDKIVEDHKKITDWTCIIAQSARVKSWSLIHENEKKKYHLSTVLTYAGESGDQKIIDHFLNKIENPTKDDYAKIVVGAARGGHENIIETYSEYVSDDDLLKIAAEQAIIYKNYDLGTQLFEFIEYELTDDELCELLGKSGDDNYIQEYYDTSVENGVIFLIEGLAHSDNPDLLFKYLTAAYDAYEEAFIAHILSGETYLIDYFIEKKVHNWNEALEAATEVENKDLIEFFIEKGATDWDRALIRAIRVQNKELIDFFLKKGANKFENAYEEALEVENDELAEFFRKKMWN